MSTKDAAEINAIRRAWTRLRARMALDEIEKPSDYARGRADAAAALRLAADREAIAGNIPSWLREGEHFPPPAHEVHAWLTDWAANIAEHGDATGDTNA